MMWTTCLIFMFLLAGENCLHIEPLEGPWIVETNSRDYIDLTCTFAFNSSEIKQLDVKWYFQDGAQPFIQWVPSTGREPQSIGEKWGNRLELTHTAGNGSFSQRVRIHKPGSQFSGQYECKVSTFLIEKRSKLNLIIYDPGEGPKLRYHTAEDGYVNISCSAKSVYPEPLLHLTWNYGQSGDEVTKTTVRRGLEYDVTVHRLLPPTDLPPETVFSCSMEIPSTQFSLREETMYFPGRIQPRASQVRNIHNFLIKIIKFVISRCSSFTEWHVRLLTVQG
ncbi:uncharacterized protein LOC111711657 [Eurytemora carolleeae]|uniref:uncharacterized protein LOC111711657 n=1 Tax=Eurytemora carolleeae TaxID=1294199 RepID=UPI000C78C8EE|nr:uncharacterized protein LOC111711657 [Eurytemora carolleeae]|eukprot:XP_023341819.1 uncharacterized protein LOC111711657 [Eurytemora affinis]